MNPLRPDEWRRLRDVFDRAMALPAGERLPFVADACLGDEGLHRRVATLVAAHERARDFLETDCVATITEWRDEDFAGAQFGPYLLESRIGGGGMGEVYRARDTRLRRTVAIKVLLPHTTADASAHERFEREARVVAGLNHPHICTLHDIGTYRAETGQRPAPYLVMEFLSGQTLADRLANGALPEEEALDYALQIASALAAAHRAGIVHRDLKPKNVMLTSAGAKLLDFGLAKAAASPALDQAATFDSDLTTPGTIIGTVQYMAPEQLEGLPTDARTDVFAFGCVFYEMLSGRPAFEGPGSARLMAAIITQQPTPLRELVPSLPDGVEALIARSLAKNPADRWTSAADLLAELERIHRDVRSVDQPGWFRRIVRQHRLAAAAVLFVLLLSGAAAMFVRSRRPADVSSVLPAPAVQLAVLPLRMVGEAIPGDAYLGVGIADSIITRLAAIRQIELRPTAAVISYAAYDGDTATVAKELGVGHVLFGTIQRSEDTYRITLQLVQASHRAVTWARSYDVLRSALTNLQDTIADEVVGALRLELTAAERDRVQRRYTDIPEAYELYLRGRASFVNYTENSMKAAIGDFDRALAIDPDYALARAGLAIACAWFGIRYAYETESSEWGARAEREAKAALASDPSLAEATLAMASAAGTLHGNFNWPDVIADATRALAIDPTLELGYVVRMRAFFHLGLFDRMAGEARAAYQLNPRGGAEILRLDVANSLFTGSYRRARDQAAALIARGSDAAIVPNYLGLAQFYGGDVVAARTTLAAVERRGRPDVRSQAALAGVEAAAGDHNAARARALAIAQGPYMDHHVAYSLAAAWAQLGDAAASVQWLQQAADTGFPCYPWMRQDPMLDPIRNDRSFVALLERLRARHEQEVARYRSGP